MANDISVPATLKSMIVMKFRKKWLLLQLGSVKEEARKNKSL